MSSKVLLGFSGGIDSTAAAIYLRDQGYDVTLLTLNTIDDQKLLAYAKVRAHDMGFNLIIADVRKEFKHKIIDYFTSSYLNGLTPAPCSLCNPVIKWNTLHRIATEGGYDHISTGHYFRIIQERGKHYIRAAADPVKDQSYYLWGLSQEQLKMIITPMGERLKTDVKASLPKDMRPRESMGVCFLGGENYVKYLQKNADITIKEGDIIDSQGSIVGSHSGCALYTIGQKKGLNTKLIGAVVTVIDPQTNTLTVGSDAELHHNNLSINSYNVVDIERLLSADRLRVKIRGFGRNPEGFCSTKLEHNKIIIQTQSPVWAAAKGQPVVFYDDDIVLGGGILDNFW